MFSTFKKQNPLLSSTDTSYMGEMNVFVSKLNFMIPRGLSKV
jgi:hypothetical protein